MYNNELLEAYLDDFDNEVEIRCQRMREEAENICSKIRNQFSLDLMKIPPSIRSMTIKEFIEKYNNSQQFLNNKNTTIIEQSQQQQQQQQQQQPNSEELEDFKQKLVDILKAPITTTLDDSR